MWPYDIGIPIKDIATLKKLPAWKVMPATAEEISEWLVVESIESKVDRVERPTVLYHPSLKDKKTRVTIRLQGFVESINLAPLGNWDGKEHTAGGTLQHLTLTDGGLTKVFKHQLDSLDELHYAILSFMRHDTHELDRPSECPNICLGHRVFHKIPLVNRKQILNALRAGDDPTGKAAKICERWRVPFRIGLGVQHEDGKIVRTTQLAVRKGDFMDVSFMPKIVTLRSRQGVQYMVKFDIQEVVRLFTRNELSDKVLSLLQPELAERGMSPIEDADSGFLYEDSGHAIN
ncbi:hypothetical protein A0H81_08556 [Grifola frondosa]|uniref:Uncharacterized protein n=1 Tax=Grifola frondosa TaxID=5627 RepID=A0A1C7M318_GRIFR|nr:hypothetical protein A0H81_08556 [Grifola frondosa]